MGRPLDPKSGHWQQVRNKMIKRDGYKCARCKTKTNLTVHHIKPRSEGGVTVARNLLTLCSECHDWAEVYDPTWDKLTHMAKDQKPQKKGKWERTEFGLQFTHDEDCSCGDCFVNIEN